MEARDRATAHYLGRCGGFPAALRAELQHKRIEANSSVIKVIGLAQGGVPGGANRYRRHHPRQRAEVSLSVLEGVRTERYQDADGVQRIRRQ